MTIAATLLAAVAVGLVLGLLGGGGSILTVPILIYLAGMPAKSAIAASLFVVGVTSLTGLVTHARGGRVRWRVGGLFAIAGMAGAYPAGRISNHLPATLLLIGFAGMMAATAVAMLRPRRLATTSDPARGRYPALLAEGLAIGAVTGLIGAGGGFVVVPALVTFAGLSMPQAVGTSLLVLTAQSTAGLAGHLHGTSVPWPLTIGVTAVAATSAVLGGRLASRVPADVLRRGFGWFVIVMAVFVLVTQAPPSILHTLEHLVGLRPD